MKTNMHFWLYLSRFFLELEVFQANALENIKIRILCLITFFLQSCPLWDSVEKCSGAGQITYDNITYAHCMLDYYTYLLTPWCRVLLEKLTGLQLVKKFPAFHGTRRFIIALISFRHLSLSWASPIQSIYPHPTSWRSILMLSTHLCLGLPSGLLPTGFPSKTLYTPSRRPYAPHAQPISGLL